MPGANYFLSQVAAQTPGPLLGAIVPPKLSPPPCMELVSPPRIQPYISVIGSKTHACSEVTTLPFREVSVFDNVIPEQRYNHSYSVSPTPLTQQPHPKITYPLPPTPHPKITFPSPQIPRQHPAPLSLPPGLGTANLPNVRKTTQDNPVGELQELCTKMRWVFPSYSIYCDESQPHDRAFSVIVRLYRFKETGEAKSKRAAKREAARRILARLRSWPTDPSVPFTGQFSHPPPNIATGMELMPFQAPQSCQQPPPSYYLSELTTLSLKHEFTAVYVKVEERTASGEIQCLLQLSTWPVGVLNGSGRTMLAAKADAAKKALDLLRVFNKSYFLPQNQALFGWPSDS